MASAPSSQARTGPGRRSRLPQAAPDRLPAPLSGLRLSPRRFRQLAILSLAMVVLIVITGAAVRLTGSGLGCPDWPSCYQTRLQAQLSFHPMVEFGNRLVTVLVTVVVAATLVASWLRAPRRRDLCWLSGGLVAGVIAQAVLGGIVVYTKLNPYLVMVHFLASMLLVADAVVLLHRAGRRYGPGSTLRQVPAPLVLLSRGLLILMALVLAAGTATTGAGPHAGDAAGQEVAKRLPVALRQMAELHSSLALLLIGVSISLAVALHALNVPERIRRTARILVMVMVAQAIVGYSQYFTHLPAALVEIHVIGATSLVVAAVWFHLSLTHHPREAHVESGGQLHAQTGDGSGELPRTLAGVPHPIDGPVGSVHASAGRGP